MTCLSRIVPPRDGAPGRYIAIERGAGGDRLLKQDGTFELRVGGTVGLAVFESPADANLAVARATNRRRGCIVDILPMRGPVALPGVSMIGSAIAALVVAGVTIAMGAVL